MKTLWTAAEIDALPDGDRHVMPPGTILTPAAIDRARLRGIELVEGGAPAPTPADSCGCGCGHTPCACPPSSTSGVAPAAAPAPSSSGPWISPFLHRGPTPELWSASPGGSSAAPIASAATAPVGAGSCLRLLVTASGPYSPRSLAELTGAIADLGLDITDLSQRVANGRFHSTLGVDAARSGLGRDEALTRLEGLSSPRGVLVQVAPSHVLESVRSGVRGVPPWN